MTKIKVPLKHLYGCQAILSSLRHCALTRHAVPAHFGVHLCAPRARVFQLLARARRVLAVFGKMRAEDSPSSWSGDSSGESLDMRRALVCAEMRSKDSESPQRIFVLRNDCNQVQEGTSI